MPSPKWIYHFTLQWRTGKARTKEAALHSATTCTLLSWWWLKKKVKTRCCLFPVFLHFWGESVGPLLSLFFLLLSVLMDFFFPLPSLAGSFVLCLWCPKSWAVFLFQVDWRCEPHTDKIQTECSAPWYKKYWDIPQESKDCCLWGMPAFGEVSWNAVHVSQVLCEFRAYKYSSSSGFQQDLARFHYIWKDFFL